MKKCILLLSLISSGQAFAQIDWTLKLDQAAPFTVREPMRIDLQRGDISMESLLGGVTCTCSTPPCPPPPGPSPVRPYYFLLDNKWYVANSGFLEFYRGVSVADNVSLTGCVRPGGLPNVVSLNMLLTSSGTQLLYLSQTATMEQRHGTRQSDGQRFHYMVLQSTTGDLTCAGAVPSPLQGDVIFRNGLENL